MSKWNKNEYQGWKKKTLSTQDEERSNFLKKLTLNKWSLTFAVMLVMFSAWLGLEEVDKRGLANQPNQQVADSQEVLYVTDTIPYDIQRVNADVDKQAENRNGQDEQNEENRQAESENVQPEPEGAEGAEEPEKQANYSINSDSDFFINYRLEREKARSRQLELLQSLIDDEKTTDEMRSEAQQKVIEQAGAIEQELMLESILVAQYGGEAVVFIQPEKVNVVLALGEAQGIANQEAEKIARLVDNYTGIGFENVIIVLKD